MILKVFLEDEIRNVIKVDTRAIEEIEKGFTAYSDGKVQVPPILRLDFPNVQGEIDVKTAVIEDLDSFALKVSSGFFDNHKLNLPSLSGLMMLFSSQTGMLKTIFLDNGYLTDVRTGIAGAIAAKYLAKQQISSVGVIGTGVQARYQVEALSLVRDFDTVHVFGRNERAAKKYAEDISATLGKQVIVHQDIESVVKNSDIVITTTPAIAPLIESKWLHPGIHITAVGSDAEHKQELEPEVFSKADLVACDIMEQCIRLGELHHAKENLIDFDLQNVVELGDIISGKTAGRVSDEQITVCDLTGTGIQDTAIARLAFELLENSKEKVK